MIDIYIDGSGTRKDKPAGIGLVIFKDNKILSCESKYIGTGTNNFAELLAMKMALQKARGHNAYGHRVHIHSDSQYALGSCRKAYSTNPLLSAHVLVLYNYCRQMTRIKKVEGHSGDLGNDLADFLAGQARRAASSFFRPPISFQLGQLECFPEKLARRIRPYCFKEELEV